MSMKSRYGKYITSSDVDTLNNLIDAVMIEACEYGEETYDSAYGKVMEAIRSIISERDFSMGLKYNARISSSWFRKYVYNYIQDRL